MINNYRCVLVGIVSIGFMSSGAASVKASEHVQSLFLAYPPENHETTSDQIFFIGTAPPNNEVQINGEIVERSEQGNFAPSFPLDLGENIFTIESDGEKIEWVVTRLSTIPVLPEEIGFAEGSLYPSVDIARLPGEFVCFEAIAQTNADVLVTVADQTIPLMPQEPWVTLPPNSAVLTFDNAPIVESSASLASHYRGCTKFETPGILGSPVYQLSVDGETLTQGAGGSVEILSPTDIQTAEVTASYGAARTGPSTNYSRLTPLPTGAQARVTGQEGNWYRLDYGVWIRDTDVTVQPGATPPRSLIRSIQSRQLDGWTEVLFPLQVPVPVTIEQGDDTFTLTLHNTTAQTDTIFVDEDPVIRRFDWTQPSPDQVQYIFQLKTNQQWGYRLRYEDTTLVLELRHPPSLPANPDSLDGISILLDPGHGGEEMGALGPTGYPEKDVNLVVSRLLRDALERRGATVHLTRDEDVAVSLSDRIDQINTIAPTLALSIHYNALPDNGDAVNTAGLGMFWYNPQSYDLSIFLHNYLVETLNRPSYGVFWNNLALTRPTTAPSVLLELGFMINPYEFEWIVNPDDQEQLAEAIATGLTEWLHAQPTESNTSPTTWSD